MHWFHFFPAINVWICNLLMSECILKFTVLFVLDGEPAMTSAWNTHAWRVYGWSGAERWLGSEADKLVPHYQAIRRVHRWQRDNIYRMSRASTREISYIVWSITILRSLFYKAEADWELSFLLINSIGYNHVALNFKAVGFKIAAILSPLRLIYKQKTCIDNLTSTNFCKWERWLFCAPVEAFRWWSGRNFSHLSLRELPIMNSNSKTKPKHDRT